MKKRMIALLLAAIMVFSINAAAEEIVETEDLAAEELAVDTAEDAVKDMEEIVAGTNAEEPAASEEPTEKTKDEIGGYYIANYANADTQVNLNILSEPDLVWAAQQAGTTIYQFREDGTVRIYAAGTVTEGTYRTEENNLTITAGGKDQNYQYEFIDSLLVLRDDASSSLLYDFAIEDMNYITMEDYSGIEIDRASVEATEEQVENYINTVLQGMTTYEQITEGTTETGDIITISYEGTLEGEQEPFEGGSAEGLALQLGSGALIGDFEDQLTGQQIGSTVVVAVTFPEDYTKIDGLAGKKANFKTTINSKTITHTPELTDEWVQEYSAQCLPEQLNTVEEYRNHCRDYLETYLLHTAMINALAAKTSITGYNLNTAQLLVSAIARSLEANAQYYGVDEQTMASSYGYESADAYEQAEATYDLNIAMIVNRVMSDLGLTYTAEELDADLNDFLRLSGFADQYTTDEYKQQLGSIGMWQYANLEFKLDLAMDALEERVVLTEQAEDLDEASDDGSGEVEESTQE